MSAPPVVLLDTLGPHVTVVTLDRPRQANAVSPELTAELAAIVRRVEGDARLRCVILRGAGEKAFCAGADLGAIARGQRDQLYTPDGGFAGFTTARRKKFWIACVEAPALAGGLELALACDMIVGSTNARFGLPEVSRAMVAAAGGIVRLPRLVPRGLALEMIATGAPISADRAYASGLINYLVEPGAAFAVALEVAERVARNAPVAVEESLAVARSAADLSEADLFDASRVAALRNASTVDFAEGPRAFLEKRDPVWSGA